MNNFILILHVIPFFLFFLDIDRWIIENKITHPIFYLTKLKNCIQFRIFVCTIIFARALEITGAYKLPFDC